MDSKPRLFVSFSGGRSSAVMVKRCLDLYSKSREVIILFANTGCEHPATLDFVDAVDKHFANGSIVWVEAIINGPGVGPTAKVVNHKTAARNGEPFRAAIAKHGIFCKTHPNCTGRLKVDPMTSYLRSIGWEKGSYETAIGIRADEVDRKSTNGVKDRYIYPLIDEGWTKPKVNAYMAQFEWDLELPSDAFGNCVWCWKKSMRKLMTVAKKAPDSFDFPGEMERRYGIITRSKKSQLNPRVFFRGRLSAQDVLKKAFTEEFNEYVDDPVGDEFDPALDVGGSCGGSCEIGADA